MRSMFSRNLKTSGKIFTVQRTSENIQGILASYNCRPHIDFPIESDIHSNDWIVNPVGEKLLITEIQDFSPYKSCYYISEHEYNSRHSQSNIFNITADKIENSIIGNQSSAIINLSNDLEQIRQMIDESSSSDKVELHQLVDLLESHSKSTESIPKGFLSKFSTVMQKILGLQDRLLAF